jgi:hypothetical protein
MLAAADWSHIHFPTAARQRAFKKDHGVCKLIVGRDEQHARQLTAND